MSHTPDHHPEALAFCVPHTPSHTSPNVALSAIGPTHSSTGHETARTFSQELFAWAGSCVHLGFKNDPIPA